MSIFKILAIQGIYCINITSKWFRIKDFSRQKMWVYFALIREKKTINCCTEIEVIPLDKYYKLYISGVPKTKYHYVEIDHMLEPSNTFVLVKYRCLDCALVKNCIFRSVLP